MQLTVRDAARYLGVNEETLRRWVDRGELPAVVVHDQYRFNRVELLEWAASRKIPVSPEILEEPGAAGPPPPRLAEAVRAGGIHYGLAGDDKASLIRSVVDVLPLPPGTDREFLYEMLLARERLGSTALGRGIAIPHPRDPLVVRLERPTASICFPERPLPFGAADGAPVHTLVVLLTPSVRTHLHLLAALATALRDPELPALLEPRAPADRILAALERVEADLARRRAEGLARSDRP